MDLWLQGERIPFERRRRRRAPGETLFRGADLAGDIIGRAALADGPYRARESLRRGVAEGRADPELVQQLAQAAGLARDDRRIVGQGQEDDAALGDEPGRIGQDDR